MSVLDGLRTLVFLRRIARAGERIADSLDELRAIERQRWQREARVPGRPPRMTEIQSLDIDEVNERWRKEQEAAEVGGVLED